MARFRRDPDFERTVARETAPELLVDAERIAAIARQIAPVRTGEYRRSIRVHFDRDPRKGGVFVAAHDWKAGLLEYGTTDTPTFATLRKAARMAGRGFRERRAQRQRMG